MNNPMVLSDSPYPKKGWAHPTVHWLQPFESSALNDRHPLVRIDDIIYSLASAIFFSALAAKNGYYPVPITAEHREKTSFSGKGNLYQFNRMPVGLYNAPARYQRILNWILKKEIAASL